MKKLLLLIAFCIVSVSVKAQDYIDYGARLKKGDLAPDFTFNISKDKTAKLSDYRGKLVLINFWATWCGPCRDEFPRLQAEIWDKYKDNPRFALLTFAREEGWDKVLPFKETNKYTFAMLPDEKRDIFKLFAKEAVPRNILLDGRGKVIFQSLGYSETEFSKLTTVLDAILNIR